jgi:hypothetical protein
MWEEICTQVWLGNHLERRHLIPVRSEDNIKMDLREIDCEVD